MSKMKRPKMKRPMSQRKYLANKGMHCPNCGGTNCRCQESIQADGILAWQGIQCNDCHSEWTDHFKLTGYGELSIPSMERSV